MKRTREVFPTGEIAHLWANQTQEAARNPQNNFYFRAETIYSYRDNYPIARIVTNKRKEKAVLIRNDSYSVTTSGHIREARTASRHLTTFNVEQVETGWGAEQDAAYNLRSYESRIKTASEAVAKSRVAHTREWRMTELIRLVDEANAFSKFYSLRKRFKVPADFDSLREELNKAKAKQAAETKARNERRIIELAEEIAEWKAGTRSRLPYDVSITYLRIEGDELVTSRGARIPVTHAMRGLRVIEAVRKSGQAYQRNGHTIHLGHYAIDSIDAKGNLKAGCHDVTYEEISRIAPELQKVITIEPETVETL